jgi:hypothetical protein
MLLPFSDQKKRLARNISYLSGSPIKIGTLTIRDSPVHRLSRRSSETDSAADAMIAGTALHSFVLYSAFGVTTSEPEHNSDSKAPRL